MGEANVRPVLLIDTKSSVINGQDNFVDSAWACDAEEDESCQELDTSSPVCLAPNVNI